MQIGKQVITRGGSRAAGNLVSKGARNRMRPDSLATGSHSVFRRCPQSGRVSHYKTFVPQTNPRNPNPWQSLKRFDGFGSGKHWNKDLGKDIYSPHVHEQTTLGGIRPAELWEIPN